MFLDRQALGPSPDDAATNDGFLLGLHVAIGPSTGDATSNDFFLVG